MRSSGQPLRILLVASDTNQAHLISAILAASTNPSFVVEHASSGWEAQRQAGDQRYQALVIDDALSDTDGETLVGRLTAAGVRAPALLLTASGEHQVTGRGKDYLSQFEAATGNSIVRAILAMVQIDDLNNDLAAAREDAARATTVLATLSHDLATPLGVVMGMTQVLLSDDNGLNADGRACLEDVSREALRACEMLKHSNGAAPTTRPTTAPVVDTRLPGLSAASVSGPGSRVVLVADDDPATRRLVCATLTSDLYSVLEAVDGEQAWRLIRDHHPAVAILDWQMPVYSGLELTDVIKGDPQVRGMTVIMLTGRTAAADREAGERARADLYLNKPFLPQDLVDAVEQALGIR